MSIQFPFAQLPLELKGEHGKYLITRDDNQRIKRGYMSVIYNARNVETQQLLALKTVWRLKDPTEEQQLNWEKAIRQFDNEINTLMRLKGIPGIIQVRDRGIQDRLPWYVMDFIDGAEITNGLKDTPLHQQIKTLRKMVKALSQAHQKGVVHMDLKPSNILLNKDGDPVILDFGISKVVEIAWESISMSTGIFGTPRYMAPEQFTGVGSNSKPVDLHQVDIWSVGVLFYEILVASHPLGVDNGDTYGQMTDKILLNNVIDLSSFDKSVDRSIAEICHRALAKEKTQRYKNASEMLHHLNQWESANFNKCILLAEEYISYQHWQDARQSALDAHLWSPYDPKMRECLQKALNGEHGAYLSVEWYEQITPEMISFWLQTRTEALPKSVAKIYHIHDKHPKFIAVDSKEGVTLREILRQREEMGEPAILTREEAKMLLDTVEEACNYFEINHFPIRGLENQNIYCFLDDVSAITGFQLWGFGWRGELIEDSLEAIRKLFEVSLADDYVPMDSEVEEWLEQSSTIEELSQLWQQEQEEEEDDDYF